jgi:hypothetical protein
MVAAFGLFDKAMTGSSKTWRSSDISDAQTSISGISSWQQLKHTVIAGSGSGLSHPYKRICHVLFIGSNTLEF